MINKCLMYIYQLILVANWKLKPIKEYVQIVVKLKYENMVTLTVDSINTI
jgi:hypothetical protein